MKIWKILFLLATGIIVVVIVGLYVASKLNPKQFAVGRSIALRSEAKIILQSAKQNILAYHASQNKYTDDPVIAFNSSVFACKARPQCLHYLYAVQASCENGGKLQIPQQSELALIDQSDFKRIAMKKAVEAVVPPCKITSQGFTVFAVGDIAEGSTFDILSIDEADVGMRILQDATSAKGK